eukprot:scaffold252838_cov42-Prasinocladus_malaysianus.AAC.1
MVVMSRLVYLSDMITHVAPDEAPLSVPPLEPDVNAAPLVVRRRELLAVGGFHAGLSCPGEAGIVFDFELSIRMWAHGYQQITAG